MDQSHDEESVTFGSHLRFFASLKKLSYVGQRNPAAAHHHLPTVHQNWSMDNPAHPTLEELELTLRYNSWRGFGAPSPALLLFSILSPTFLNAFPTLQFLHINHFYQASGGEDSKKAFKDYQIQALNPLVRDGEFHGLASELARYLGQIQCPKSLVRIWIDLGNHSRSQTSAVRFRAERAMSGRWKVTWGKCALHEQFLTIQELPTRVDWSSRSC
ncbi:hypothetical protein DL93DRAFT_2092205 [Clavulina sp. PMI_390]|nr:hypothetical protein DL93DRAFT_2092205 [Clavulina sp. PMI_390]